MDKTYNNQAFDSQILTEVETKKFVFSIQRTLPGSSNIFLMGVSFYNKEGLLDINYFNRSHEAFAFILTHNGQEIDAEMERAQKFLKENEAAYDGPFKWWHHPKYVSELPEEDGSRTGLRIHYIE